MHDGKATHNIMIRSEKSTSQEACGSDCWKENPNCAALRIEPDEGGIFLLPYKHLAFCHFEPAEEGDQLAIVFATHAVVLKGRRLGGLLPALQKETVEWVRTIPERYEAIQDGERVFILSIGVDTYVRQDEE